MLTVSIQDGVARLASDAPAQDVPVMAAALRQLCAINRKMRISLDEMDAINARFDNGPRAFECDYAVIENQLFLIGPSQGLLCIANRLNFA